MFKRIFIVFSALLIFFAISTNVFAEETIEYSLQNQIESEEILQVLESFEKAGLPVLNPTLVRKDDLGKEPFVTEEMYDFGILPNENRDLLTGTIYSVKTFNEMKVLEEYFNDSNLHIAKKDNLLLVMDYQVVEEVFAAYETVFMNPGGEHKFDWNKLISQQVPKTMKNEKITEATKENAAQTRRTINLEEDLFLMLFAPLIEYWNYIDETGYDLTFDQYNDPEFMYMYDGGKYWDPGIGYTGLNPDRMGPEEGTQEYIDWYEDEQQFINDSLYNEEYYQEDHEYCFEGLYGENYEGPYDEDYYNYPSHEELHEQYEEFFNNQSNYAD